MPLEGLLKLVGTLRERIKGHDAALRQSEALTRYALIDPLLRELGWDTANPEMVIPEYRSGSGRADYALMSGDNPAMMVEAKSLDTPLRDGVLAQGINYCLMQGTSFFCVTDGRRWEIYETHKPVPIDQKRIASFDLKDNPAQVCLNALALWRSGLESGQVGLGQAPVVGLPQQQPTPVEPHAVQPTPIEDPVVESAPTITAPTRESWLPLSEFNPSKRSTPPSEIKFPDDSTVLVETWKSLEIESIRWLVCNDFLSHFDCPIQLPRAKTRFFIHETPIHPTGSLFSHRVQIGSLYIEPVRKSGNQVVRAIQHVIEYIGQDPAEFRVRVS